MTYRLDLQQRLDQITRNIDPDATISYDFDRCQFIVRAPDRRDLVLSDERVADLQDDQLENGIRLEWGL